MSVNYDEKNLLKWGMINLCVSQPNLYTQNACPKRSFLIEPDR